MNSKLKILHAVTENQNGPDYMFWCPGCKETHGVWTKHRNGLGASWSFNGNMERPTFSPSLLLRYTKLPPVDSNTGDFARDASGKYITGPDGKIAGCKEAICHSFVRDGTIQFLSDCTHDLRGQTVPMTPFLE